MATANETEDTAAVEIRGPLQPGDGAVAALSAAEARPAARPPPGIGDNAHHMMPLFAVHHPPQRSGPPTLAVTVSPKVITAGLLPQLRLPQLPDTLHHPMMPTYLICELKNLGDFCRSLSEQEGDSRLIQAAQLGALEQLRLLMAAGADVRMRDASRQTALHWAADKGHLQVARCLLEGGAEADARDSGQSTSVHVAALYGHTALVQLQLEWKADPNARNELERTPLHFVAVFSHEESAAALLEAGANREVRDGGGKTPLQLARQYNQQKLAQMLT
ncbi:ankyrin repeat domain-containing protein 6-like [Schistocerca americana]|uniref:ankyrin repeat domain-containing protein 6-like n=1 Tax=Schistocerca americana TaxID=7009 RepID=UPI001F4FBDCE|nr:ankyrin repeat domain-containing protein 6-like [Schistocerca americana]